MKTYYLKTNNEQELWELLESNSLAHKEYDLEDEANINTDNAEDFVMSGKYEWQFDGVALDIIGVIHKETGNVLTDADGNEYNETVALEGFHANLIGVEGLPLVSETPLTPYRIFG